MKISKNWLLVAGVVASAVVLVGTRVLADNAWDIMSYTASNTVVTYDGSGDGGSQMAVIDAIVNQPKTDAHGTYTSWSLLVGDAGGSLLVYMSTAGAASFGYTNPALGDQITVTGNYAPYHSIPEFGTPYTTFTKLSGGNAVAGPVSTSIGTILANAGLGNTDASYGNAHPSDSQANLALSEGLNADIVEIPDVTISGQNTLVNFPNTNYTFTMTDSGGKQLTMYYWVTSYSADGDMIGGTIPTWPVNVYGFLSSYPSKLATSLGGTNIWQDELIPTAFVGAIPEPSSFMLAGMGLLSLVAVMRRRRS
jgi:hypothetical protein